MRIDSHQHFWKFSPKLDAWITENMKVLRNDFMPNHLQPILTDNNVDACVAVQAAQSSTETSFLLDLAEVFNFIPAVVGWVDLQSDEAEQKLEWMATFQKLKGFRHIVQAEPDGFMDGEAFRRGIAALGKHNYTYDILIAPNQMPEALRLVHAFSDQRFVIDHMAKPLVNTGELEPWGSMMKELAQNPNVYCKVSGLTTEADWSNWQPEQFSPYLDVVFDAYGAKRLMYGSDWPVCLLVGKYAEGKTILEKYCEGMEQTDKDFVFGNTAAEFYGI